MSESNLNFKHVKNTEKWRDSTGELSHYIHALEEFMDLTYVRRLKKKKDFWYFGYRLQIAFPKINFKERFFNDHIVFDYYFKGINYSILLDDLIDLQGICFEKLYSTSNEKYFGFIHDSLKMNSIKHNYFETNFSFIDPTSEEQDYYLNVRETSAEFLIDQALKERAKAFADYLEQHIPEYAVITHEKNEFFDFIFTGITHLQDPDCLQHLQTYFTHFDEVPDVHETENFIFIYLKETSESDKYFYKLILEEIEEKLQSGMIKECCEQLQELTDIHGPFNLDLLLKLKDLLNDLEDSQLENQLDEICFRILRVNPNLIEE